MTEADTGCDERGDDTEHDPATGGHDDLATSTRARTARPHGVRRTITALFGNLTTEDKIK